MSNIHHRLFISAPPEKVYRAITTSAGLAAWWTPGAEAQPQINSVARFPFQDGYVKEMEIKALEHAKLVKWTCLKGDEQWVGTSMTFELQPADPSNMTSVAEMRDQVEQAEDDTGTILTFHHDDWKGYTAMFAECSYTWGQFLRSLKLYCETGLGHPWPKQLQVN